MAIDQGQDTVYIIDMGRRIGWVGGKQGAKIGNPGTQYLQLVIRGTRDVVTAYPVGVK